MFNVTENTSDQKNKILKSSQHKKEKLQFKHNIIPKLLNNIIANRINLNSNNTV